VQRSFVVGRGVLVVVSLNLIAGRGSSPQKHCEFYYAHSDGSRDSAGIKLLYSSTY